MTALNLNSKYIELMAQIKQGLVVSHARSYQQAYDCINAIDDCITNNKDITATIADVDISDLFIFADTVGIIDDALRGCLECLYTEINDELNDFDLQ